MKTTKVMVEVENEGGSHTTKMGSGLTYESLG